MRFKNISNTHIKRFGPPFHQALGSSFFIPVTHPNVFRTDTYGRLLLFCSIIIIFNNFSKCNLGKSYIYRQVAVVFLFSTLTITSILVEDGGIGGGQVYMIQYQR